MNDLIEHFERLEWVRSEIARLDEQVTTYTQSEPLEVYWHHDLAPTNPMRIYRMRLTRPIPRPLQIHSGTIINELRAILDAVACTLANRNGFDDVSGTYFPTGKSKKVFESGQVQRKIRKLSEMDQAAIAGLEPYLGGNDLLYALHSSDIIRKHQRLIVLSGGVGSSSIGSAKGWVLDGSKLDYIHTGPGCPLDQPVARTAPDFHVEIKQSALVTFAEPDAIKTKPVIATLNDFASLVQSILELFN